MAGISTTGPGAVRVRPGTIELNADRSPEERREFVVLNTGDRPVQIGSHLHLPDANPALDLDRAGAHGFRLDIPSGTSRRFEPGASAVVQAVALRGARRVPGIRPRSDGGWLDGVPEDDGGAATHPVGTATGQVETGERTDG